MKIENLFEDDSLNNEEDLATSAGAVVTGPVFINEIHYDNSGSDVGEFIELKSNDPTEDFSDYQVYLYNGSNGELYGSILDAGDGTVTSDGTCSFITFTVSGIQNGGPDGLALVNGSTGAVCEFLSYEGSFDATEGPADGMTSTDIGVAETSGTPAGQSLQLDPVSGMWIGPTTATPGTANCFVNGTRILTNNGEVKVEDLKIGDIVMNNEGKEFPVKWIGYQQIDPQSNIERNPILIKKSALGANIPSRDLYVSSDHAIFVDNLLINAAALVNNDTIIEHVPTDTFTYYHIELDQHAVIMAENLPAETYLPQNKSRATFDNGSSYIETEGNNILLWPLDYPRISSAHKVPFSIKNKINNFSKLHGKKAI